MKKELDYYKIGEFHGGDQDWFKDLWMKYAGCGAITACDSCIYFDRRFKKNLLSPINVNQISKDDFINFGMIMKPYLSPRFKGIDRLEIFIDEFRVYLNEKGANHIKMDPYSGNNDIDEAKTIIKKQIDKGFIIPYLNLKHQDKSLKDYEWHWFMLAGYEENEHGFNVKAMSYGKGVWFNFDNLWNTGKKRKGGMVLYSV